MTRRVYGKVPERAKELDVADEMEREKGTRPLIWLRNSRIARKSPGQSVDGRENRALVRPRENAQEI